MDGLSYWCAGMVSFLHPFASVKRPRTCAIVQFEAVHEEIIPSLAHALNRLAVRPSIYINRRCLEDRGDIFAEMDALQFDLEYVPMTSRQDWTALAKTISCQSHEFLMLATFQRDGIAAWAEDLSVPVLGVVHNGNIFLKAERCVRLVKEKNAKLVCLAPHVAVYMHQRLPTHHIDDVAVVEPVYWGERSEQDLARESSHSETRRVVIPGGVNFATRGFRDLVNALRNWSNIRDGEVTFQVLGGGKDRTALEELVQGEGLGGAFEFADLGPSGRVMYDDYLRGLRSADFLHPLAPLSFPPYREHKITSAIPTSVGFVLPSALDRWTARTYRIPAIVSDATVADSLQALVGASWAEHSKYRRALYECRNSCLKRNVEEVARVLNRLRAPAGISPP